MLSELQMNELHVPDVMYQPGGSRRIKPPSPAGGLVLFGVDPTVKTRRQKTHSPDALSARVR